MTSGRATDQGAIADGGLVTPSVRMMVDRTKPMTKFYTERRSASRPKYRKATRKRTIIKDGTSSKDGSDARFLECEVASGAAEHGEGCPERGRTESGTGCERLEQRIAEAAAEESKREEDRSTDTGQGNGCRQGERGKERVERGRQAA